MVLLDTLLSGLKEDELLYQCLLWLHDAWLICTQIKHICLNTVPLIKATSGLGFIVWTGFFYNWKAEQMQFSWTLKCKYKDYSALFSKSMSVHCTVFWFPPHRSLHLKMGYFPCSEGVPLLAGVAVLWAVLPVFTHHATSPAVAWLAAYRWKARISYCKNRTLCCLSPTAQGHVQQDISNHTQTQWIQWKLFLCTSCDVGASPWALM